MTAFDIISCLTLVTNISWFILIVFYQLFCHTIFKFSLSRRMIQSSNFHQSKRVNLKEETRTFIVLETVLAPYYFEFRIFTDKNWHWVGLSSCNLRDCDRMAFSFHILLMLGQAHFLCVCVSFYFWCNDLVMIPLGLSIDNDIFCP